MIVIASSKKWFINRISEKDFEDKYKLITQKTELNFKNLVDIGPKFIFFPHWNWKVPSEIYKNFECILFHIAPLPEGRGGSPIQNLILGGYSSAPLNAVKMIEEMDAGPIYLSKNLDLNGKLSEIFDRATPLIISMINEIIKNKPNAKPQKGEPTYFRRRTNNDNKLPIEKADLVEIYDFIRMLDHDEYPKPYLDIGEYRLFFDLAEINDGEVISRVRITKRLH